MAPTSSSPTSAVEFSHSPRTPASDHSKNARIPADREIPGSGSLHRRIFNTLRSRSRSRSRSLSRTQEDSSPTARTMGRRKSLVNIFKVVSRSTGDDRREKQLHTNKPEESRPKENFADLFTHLPARRKSIGNLWNQSHMLGTITNRVSQRRIPIQQDTPTEVKVQIGEHAELSKKNEDNKENIETALPQVHLPIDETEQNGRGPLYIRLSEESTNDMVLLGSRLSRILDGLRSDNFEEKSRDSSPNTQKKIPVEAQYIRDETAGAGTPGSMLPLIGDLCHETQGNSGRGTPDSYLQQLIQSCKDTQQNVSDLIPNLILHETTQQCSRAEQKSRQFTPETYLQVLKEPYDRTQQTTSPCISESLLLLQQVGITQRGRKVEKMTQPCTSGPTRRQLLPASYATTEQNGQSSSPDLCLQMLKEFPEKNGSASETSEQPAVDTRLAEHEGYYMDSSTRMVWRKQFVKMPTPTSGYLGHPHERPREVNSSHENMSNFNKIARNPPINPATGLLFNHDYEVRETTPDLKNHDHLLSRRNFYAGRPVVTDCEVSRTSSPIDLDPDFFHRQEERLEIYQKLGLVPSADWKSNQERIIRSIESTVARMTRNYHSSSNGTRAYTATEELSQPNTTARAAPIDCAVKFRENEKGVWDAIRIGTHLLTQTETIGRRQYIPSHNFMVDSSLSDDTMLHKCSEDSVSPAVPSNRRIQIESDEESIESSGQCIDIHEGAEGCYPGFLTSDIFLPSVDDVLEETIILRTNLEPFYAVWHPTKMEMGSVDLDKFGADYCPEYDRFVQRSYGSLAPGLSASFHKETHSSEIPSTIREAQEWRASSQESQLNSFTATQVQFPETVNLLQHTEAFASRKEAISAVCNYKLGELSNFCTYDTESDIIYAHSIDTTVPNPADLKPGLHIIWLPMNNHLPTGDARQSGHEAIETSSNSEIEDSGVGFVAVVHSSSSSELGATSEREVSIVNSIMDDDFFLINDSASQFSEEPSQFGFSGMGDTRHLLSDVDVMSSLDVEEETRPTRTWLDFAMSLRTNQSDQAKSESDISDEEHKCDCRCESTDEICYLHKGLQPPVNSETGSAEGSDNEDGGLVVRYDTHRFVIPTSDEEEAAEPAVRYRYSPPKRTGKEHRGGMGKRSSGSEESQNSLDSKGPDCASTCGSVGIEHPAGYHFTTVREHLIQRSEDSQKSSYIAPEQAIEVLFDATEYIGIGTKSQSDKVEHCVPTEIGWNIAASEPNKNVIPDDDFCHSLEDMPREVNLSIIETPGMDKRVKYDVSSETRYGIDPTKIQENQVTLEDLNLRFVGKASRTSLPTKKEKSKVGTLVNMFQAHGLMPEQPRGLLHVASMSPSFSSHRGTRHGGESSHGIVGPGSVRKISESLSATSHSVSSPVNRVTTPSSPLDRPHSRRSDIDTEDVDTEACYSFGELLRRVDKNDDKMDAGQSMWDDEMYG